MPTLSPDGVAVTHHFEDMTALVGFKSQPESNVRTITIRSTLGQHDKPVKIRQVLRGSIDVKPGVEATLLLQSCGQATLVALPKSGKGDFQAEVIGEIASGPDYLATISPSSSEAPAT